MFSVFGFFTFAFTDVNLYSRNFENKPSLKFRFLFGSLLDREWESDGSKTPKVTGRLKDHINYWETFAPFYVLSIIREGYKIPFTTLPPPFEAKNNKSSRKNRDFVTSAVQDLISNECIREVGTKPYCCNPLTVADSAGKLRLVLDLRHVNRYVKLERFKYENLSTLAQMFESGDFFIIFDLKNGYHHVSIHEDFFQYLGFQWPDESGNLHYYVFLVLPFGLNIACYVFTKILRPFVKKWRSRGYKSIIYIDDGISGMSSEDKASLAASYIKTDLQSAGWVINVAKSNFNPTQIGKWLGTIVNTKNMTFSVPPEKVAKLKTKINNAMDSESVTARHLASIAGSLNSTHLAVGPLVRMMTRSVYAQVTDAPAWDYRVFLNSHSRQELSFWSETYDFDIGYTFKFKPVTAKVIFTDASDFGYGGFLLRRLGKDIVRGSFSHEEQNKSSTERELLGVLYVLQSLAQKLSHTSVRIYVDNYGASRILQIGSPNTHLQHIAVEILKISLVNDIKILPQWVPRELNYVADYYSKLKDTDDYSMDEHSFQLINQKYGPFTFDRFADNINTRTSRFNSKFYCPGTCGVDTFTENWHGEINYLCPPVSLITAAIRHLQICKATGVLVVPVWQSSYFWPTLYPDGFAMPTFVKDFTVFKPYWYSKGRNSAFVGRPSFDSMALLCQF